MGVCRKRLWCVYARAADRNTIGQFRFVDENYSRRVAPSTTGRSLRMNAEKRTHGLFLAAILPDLCRDRGWQAQVEAYSLLLRWADVVDAETAAHSRPGKIVAGVLWIEVESPAWMQQFQYRREEILAALNCRLRHARIKEIRFRLPEQKNTVVQMEPESPAVSFSPPDPAALTAFTQLVAAVKDQNCRQALMNFWYLSHACRKDEDIAVEK